MTTWLSRRYSVELIDDELRVLRAAKLDLPAGPRRDAILARIDQLLDQRNAAGGRHGKPEL